MSKNLYNFKSLTDIASSRALDPNQFLNLSQNEFEKNQNDLTDQEIKNRIKMLSNQTLCSSQRMLNYCEKSEIFGVNTARLLNEQDEKLNRIEYDIGNMGANLKEVDKNLKELNKSGFCVNFITFLEVIRDLLCCCFKKNKKTKKKSRTKITLGNDNKLSQLLLSQSSDLGSEDLQASFDNNIFSLKKLVSAESINNLKNKNDNIFSRIRLRKVDSTISANEKKNSKASQGGEDLNESLSDVKVQLNENLKTIYSKLDDLQFMALDIGNMINKQTDKINNMDQSTGITLTKVQDTDKFGRAICSTKSNKSIWSKLLPSKKKSKTE
ncbi:unnamed protein product [Brachionus calyciflorus]|uniref:t-SNARE coiled-coil homology domain-containing protein n=1 Tax=Brachionus calyciflorus TaxID=104777 RepID=A0A813M0H5_9BILA|nr:unnamed protein product [Brachionus calyciflorus]